MSVNDEIADEYEKIAESYATLARLLRGLNQPQPQSPVPVRGRSRPKRRDPHSPRGQVRSFVLAAKAPFTVADAARATGLPTTAVSGHLTKLVGIGEAKRVSHGVYSRP